MFFDFAVEELLPQLTDEMRAQLQQCKLSAKVNELLDRAIQTLATMHSSNYKHESKSSISTTINNEEVISISNDKENHHGKRKRSTEVSNNSSNEEIASHHKNATRKHFVHSTKKRRILEPYCFLSSKALQRHKQRFYAKILTGTSDEDVTLEDEDDEGWSNSSLEESATISSDAEDDDSKNKVFEGEKPTKESTPRSKQDKNGDLVAPILPVCR